jgi:ABC-type sulfate/molybdate transport systems ATPase subunit
MSAFDKSGIAMVVVLSVGGVWRDDPAKKISTQPNHPFLASVAGRLGYQHHHSNRQYNAEGTQEEENVLVNQWR